MTAVYAQQMLAGDRRVGFRNSNEEEWQMYTTPPNGAFLNFSKSGGGYEPSLEWVRESV